MKLKFGKSHISAIKIWCDDNIGEQNIVWRFVEEKENEDDVHWQYPYIWFNNPEDAIVFKLSCEHYIGR